MYMFEEGYKKYEVLFELGNEECLRFIHFAYVAKRNV
jgi:hypothetical protein